MKFKAGDIVQSVYLNADTIGVIYYANGSGANVYWLNRPEYLGIGQRYGVTALRLYDKVYDKI